jgi:hypothetical protein
MRLIGFDFTKISGEKSGKYEPEFATNTNIDITEIIEEKAEFLQNLEIVKVSFNFSITYAKKEKEEAKFGDVVLAGHLLFSSQEEEAKELLKNWKNKNEKAIPANFRIPLFNLILRKCTPKALDLEDSLGLPFHMPLPSLGIKKESKKENKK